MASLKRWFNYAGGKPNTDPRVHEKWERTYQRLQRMGVRSAALLYGRPWDGKPE